MIATASAVAAAAAGCGRGSGGGGGGGGGPTVMASAGPMQKMVHFMLLSLLPLSLDYERSLASAHSRTTVGAFLVEFFLMLALEFDFTIRGLGPNGPRPQT